MAKYRFFTVGFDLPGDDFEYIDFNSDRTLLDADVILFEPTLGYYYTSGSYNGRPLLTEQSSFTTKQQLDHWRSEIVLAVQAGKLVIVYLAKPIDYYRHTGQKQFSGTGRSRVTTNIVTEISSYEAIPHLKGVTAKSGKEIRLEKDASYLAPYWKDEKQRGRVFILDNLAGRPSRKMAGRGANISFRHFSGSNRFFCPNPLPAD